MAPEIDQRLRRAFFERFGGRPRPLQEAAFQALREDRDALVSAGTGAGKTEAALLPVAARLLDRPPERGGLGALVVSPTRALASDLHARMAPIFERLGLRLDVATGDRNTTGPGARSDVLIRTPEGFDATLCRHPEALAGIADVVIDEVHVLLGTARGTQLAGLLARLAAVAPDHRRVGISATLPDLSLPHRARLLRDPAIVQDGDPREIQITIHHWVGSGPQGVPSFLRALREMDCRKAIGFARSRTRVEEICGFLDAGFLRERCFVHHAAISPALRRATEARLREMKTGLVIATTTLEVGIDIGDVDTCILFDLPPDVSSFLQRSGRSGRRGAARRVVCVAGLFDRAADFAAQIGQIRTGSMARPADARPHLAGLLQQAASFAARGAASPRQIESFLASTFEMPPPACAAIVKALHDARVLLASGDRLGLGELGRSMFEDRSLHRTFAGDAGPRVYDHGSGRFLGVSLIASDEVVRLGGRGRRVTRVDTRTGRVLTSPAEGGTAAFAPPGGSVFERIAARCAPLVGPAARA